MNTDSARTLPRTGQAPARVSLREATAVWAKIGLLSFGGPAGQIALMHRVLVDEKRWIGEDRFLHALNFCMLLPGPEAQQLATYVGWLLHRMRGGLIAGILFILPGFAVILGLSYLYVTAGNLQPVQGLFVGLKSAVIVIVVQAVVRIGRRSLKGPVPIGIAIAAFLAMYGWHVPFPLVIVAAGLAGAFAGKATRQADPIEPNTDPGDDAVGGTAARTFGIVLAFGTLWLAPTALLATLAGPDDVFTDIGLFFSKMAVVTFGGAYAVLAYVSQEAVATYHWLAPGEMIDGLALAETTPGPLIMVTQFVGFLAAWREPGSLPPGLAALAGAVLTTWVTFTPCFLWIFAGAPYVERLRRSRALSGALAGVTAAVVGVIANLALWFSAHALFESIGIYEFAGAAVELPQPGSARLVPISIAAVAALLMFGFRRGVVTTLAVAGLLGVAATL